jgi:TetR/AcrR family transcriptional repressor of lmrAB and yxaGH operons
MPRTAQHRERLLQTAVRLFRQKGFASTGLSEILTRSGAPKGSLYHYFPDGKEEIGAEAVAAAGEVVASTLEGLLEQTRSGADFVQAYARLLARWIAASDFRDGCPIATTLLETAPGSERITSAGHEVLQHWTRLIGRAFERDGMSPDKAAERAVLVIAAIEGALLLSRVQRSTAPIEAVARQLA